MAGTLAVGFFDGVHLGHQAILSGADEALTFRNHPLSVLAPERAPRLIMSCEDRIAAIRACGVAKVTALEFTPELAKLPRQNFAATYLAGKRIRCGVNWRFGSGGRGDAGFLSSHGYKVTVVQPVTFVDATSVSRQNDTISSTRIRASLESGRVVEANAMLGHLFQVRGLPFQGKGEGRSLGYPTVNLHLRELSLKLPLGVYAVEVGGVSGLANYGCAPTFGERAWEEPVLEVHFTGEVPKIDGASSTVGFKKFIRAERKFATFDELKAQIAEDIRSFENLRRLHGVSPGGVSSGGCISSKEMI